MTPRKLSTSYVPFYPLSVPESSRADSPLDVQFEIDIHADANSKQPVKDLVRSKIIPQLRKALPKLGPALIAEHGKDLQHALGASPALEPTTVTTSSTAAQANAKPSSTSKSNSTASRTSSVNTTTVNSNEEFRTTAAELYETFTSPDRLSAFTRARPKVFEGAHVGGRFELFDGNVSGRFTELTKPIKIVQKWRLAQWPEGHYSTLKIEFDQNEIDAVTVMRVVWEGVPVGQEEVTRRNWGEYYVRSMKKTFGYAFPLRIPEDKLSHGLARLSMQPKASRTVIVIRPWSKSEHDQMPRRLPYCGRIISFHILFRYERS